MKEKNTLNEEIGAVVKIRTSPPFVQKKRKPRKKSMAAVAKIYKKINSQVPPLWHLVAEKINFMQN